MRTMGAGAIISVFEEQEFKAIIVAAFSTVDLGGLSVLGFARVASAVSDECIFASENVSTIAYYFQCLR